MLNALRSCLVCISLIMAGPGATATEPTYLENLREQARSQKLWQQSHWLDLLHYRRGSWPGVAYSSPVNTPAFFNAETGKNDPEAELLATLDAFFQTQSSDHTHARCRFPARFHWLQQRLNIRSNQLPAVACPDYQAWREAVRAHQATLVFPAYHLNSPSSMYGHTLLRLDPEPIPGWSEWLSYSVSFGANIRASDHSLLYAFKGLTGGYPGQFVVLPYFKKIQEYNQIENRDIWEYRLNLSPAEVSHLADHIWELQNVDFDYYFFKENCAYRLLELLEIARPGHSLTEAYHFAAIPVDTVRTVQQAGMIEATHYRPSQSTVLERRLQTMPETEQAVLARLLADPASGHTPRFQQQPLRAQKRLAETAYQLLRYRQRHNTATTDSAQHNYDLLSLINQFPKEEPAPLPPPISPEKSHGSKRAWIGFGYRHKATYTELGFRMAFHSLDDPPQGFLHGAQINMGSVRLRVNEYDHLFLQRFDLVDIFSLTPRSRFFRPLSWRVKTGLDRQFIKGRDRLTAHVSGGGGWSWRPWTDKGQLYTLLTGRLAHNSGLKYPLELAIGGAVGGVYHWDSGTTHAELHSEVYISGVHRSRFKLRHNFILSQNQALKLSLSHEWYRRDTVSSIALAYHYYF